MVEEGEVEVGKVIFREEGLLKGRSKEFRFGYKEYG